jgi:hypothetical protein
MRVRNGYHGDTHLITIDSGVVGFSIVASIRVFVIQLRMPAMTRSAVSIHIARLSPSKFTIYDEAEFFHIP